MASQHEFGDWRLAAHTDTPYPHAHVLLFGDRAYGRKHDKIMPSDEQHGVIALLLP